MRRTQKWKELSKKNMQCSLRRCESNIRTTIKKKNWAFYSVTWAVAVVSVQTSCLTLFLKITSLSAVLGDFCGFSSVPDTRFILPEIPALFQAIVQPTDPKSRPETARKPPLQHERRGHHLNNNIIAVNMTQQCLTHAEEVITHVCVITLLPESSRAHLSPGPPSIVCHSSWRWADLAEGCGKPERRCSATHGQSQV